jgi:hypothetical protein
MAAVQNTPEAKIKRSMISREIRSRPEVIMKMTIALSNRLVNSDTRVKLSESRRKNHKMPPSSKSCKKHGLLTTTQFYTRINRKTGSYRTICKACTKTHNAIMFQNRKDKSLSN